MVNWDVRIICRRAVALASLWSEVKRTRSDDELVEEIVQVMIHHAKDP